MKHSAETATAAERDDAVSTILQMERAALDRWGKGDPDGFLEISDPGVVYFDPFQAKRVDGIEELRRLYSDLRGKINIRHYEIIAPKVEVDGNTALLTFNFVSQVSLSQGSEREMRWNATEIYCYRDGKWRIIHSHWSLTQPKLAG